MSWTSHKLHIDPAYGGIPISHLLTSASLYARQAAMALTTMLQESPVSPIRPDSAG